MRPYCTIDANEPISLTHTFLDASMVLQNYQNFSEMTSNMIYIVAFGVGLKCQHKIHLNTQWGRGRVKIQEKLATLFMDDPDRLRPYSIGCTNVLQRLLKCVQQVQMVPDFLEKVQGKR